MIVFGGDFVKKYDPVAEIDMIDDLWKTFKLFYDQHFDDRNVELEATAEEIKDCLDHLVDLIWEFE